MRERLSTVTSKGQVTIPVEIRRFLGLAAHEKVVFILEADQVRLMRNGSVVERTAGMLKSKRPPLTAQQLREAAEQAMAEEAEERLED